MKRIGILGYGSIGQYLARQILENPDIQKELELAFVWNRTPSRLNDGFLPNTYHLSGALDPAFSNYLSMHPNGVDLVVEVAHPDVAKAYGATILQHSDLLISSITAFADSSAERQLLESAQNFGLYLPTGAGWGIQDIQKMNRLGTLKGLRVSMQFDAEALRLEEPLHSTLLAYQKDENRLAPLRLIQGNVRQIAWLAPNNVNTMACLALAGNSIGLDRTEGVLIAAKNQGAHIIDIEIKGPDGFWVKTSRYNPAKKGAVTGSQTYASFLYSLLQAGRLGGGLHFC